MKNTWNNLVQWVRSLDVYIVLIVLLIAVSTGHVGRLFADREDARQAFIGYVLAVSIDGVLAVSLYRVGNVRRRSHRMYALFVFLCACAVSAGFNTGYYRQNYPQDPLILSVLLGATAPVLAAFVSVLRAFGDVERTETEHMEREAERSLQLEIRTLELAEQTERELLLEQERTQRDLMLAKEQTKQDRARARAEQARVNAIEQAKRTPLIQRSERRKSGELDEMARLILLEQPNIGPRPLARELECAPSTASRILERIRASNGSGAEG